MNTFKTEQPREEFIYKVTFDFFESRRSHLQDASINYGLAEFIDDQRDTEIEFLKQKLCIQDKPMPEDFGLEPVIYESYQSKSHASISEWESHKKAGYVAFIMFVPFSIPIAISHFALRWFRKSSIQRQFKEHLPALNQYRSALTRYHEDVDHIAIHRQEIRSKIWQQSHK